MTGVLPAWERLRLGFGRWGQRSLSQGGDAADLAGRALGSKGRISGGLVAGLTFALFMVLSSGLVVGFAEPPALPSWSPAQVAHQSGPCGAVEEGSWLPGGNLRLAGWACNPRTGKSIRAIILVRQGRVLPVVAFRANCPQAPKLQKPPDAGWVAFVPARLVDQREGYPEVFAVLEDGRFAPLPTVFDRSPASTPRVASLPAAQPTERR